MNLSTSSSPEHRESQELLPWLANGTLSGTSRQRLEVHLQTCEACRRELDAQRRLVATMSADHGVERMPGAGLQRLRQRIDALRVIDTSGTHTAQQAGGTDSAGADATGERTGSPGARLVAGVAWPLMRWGNPAMAAAALLVCAVGGAIWLQSHRAVGLAHYQTVTNLAPQPAGAVIRAVFAPTLTVSELQAVLEDAKLKIVAGPTPAGVYSLAMSGSPSPDWSLQRLRRHDTVRFAEPIGAAAASPP
jgi:hypothetical protein